MKTQWEPSRDWPRHRLIEFADDARHSEALRIRALEILGDKVGFVPSPIEALREAALAVMNDNRVPDELCARLARALLPYYPPEAPAQPQGDTNAASGSDSP